MDMTTVLQLVKDRLGVTKPVRDSYLTAIINGVIDELENEKGLAIDLAKPRHLMFVVDYSVWRYESVREPGNAPAGRVPLSMPRHLQFRLHNLIVQAGGQDV